MGHKNQKGRRRKMKKCFIALVIILLSPIICFAAINNYTTWVDLACANTAGILVNDIVTGADSGAVGLVYSVTNNTKFTVVMISGTFDNSGSGGEVISNQDSDTCTITDRVATTETTPTNCVIVTGDNTASTDIFRDIRNASNSGGWGLHTDPSATSHFLLLDALIYIGRRDDSSQSKAISKNEIVDLRAGDVLNEIRICGNSSYKARLEFGEADYVSDDEGNFPPYLTQNGSKIKIGGTGINATNFSEFRFYNSDTYGGGTDGGISSDVGADTLICDSRTHDVGFLYFSDSTIKVENLTRYNDGGLVITAGGQTWNNSKTVGSTYDVFFVGAVYGDITGVTNLTSAGATSGSYGGFAANAFFQLINNKVKPDSLAAFLASQVLIDLKTVDLYVSDYLNNPIENANVSITDSTGFTALLEDTGEVITAITADTDTGETLSSNINSTATSFNISDASGLSVGDIIQVSNEFMLITNISSNTLTVTRGYWNTIAESHNSGKSIFTPSDSFTVSDASGLSAGDVICFEVERAEITNIAGNVLTIDRAIHDSVATRFSKISLNNTQIYKEVDSVQTDSNGEIAQQSLRRYVNYSYSSSTNAFVNTENKYNLNPFIITIYKDGYETYTQKFVLGSDTTAESFKTDAINWRIKLRNSLSQGRDNMAEAFK